MGASTLEKKDKGRSRESLDELLGQTSGGGDVVELEDWPAKSDPGSAQGEGAAGPSTEERGKGPAIPVEQVPGKGASETAEGPVAIQTRPEDIPLPADETDVEDADQSAAEALSAMVAEALEYSEALDRSQAQPTTAAAGTEGPYVSPEAAALRLSEMMTIIAIGPEEGADVAEAAKQTETPAERPTAPPAAAAVAGSSGLRQRHGGAASASVAEASSSAVAPQAPQDAGRDLELGGSKNQQARMAQSQRDARRTFPWLKKTEEPDLNESIANWWKDGNVVPKYKEQVETDIALQPALISRKKARNYDQFLTEGYPGAEHIVVLQREKKRSQVEGKGKEPVRSDDEDSDEDAREFATMIVRDQRQVLVEFEPDMATMTGGFVREEGGDFTQRVEWDHARNQWVSPDQRRANMIATGKAMQGVYNEVLSKTEHLSENKELMLQLEQYVKTTAASIHQLFKGEKTDTEITNEILQHCRDIAKLNYDRNERKDDIRRHKIPTPFQIVTLIAGIISLTIIARRFLPDPNAGRDNPV
ncbi:hypothetical protein [Thalassococcus sp. S3]|uniref:hypothetical protein n=1 Tax=Thalassococcus sp. S3 TaxID=2017482 RepID=UPI001024637C|nr:hypothetical protein [Thalassococcus sp. S3]QBF33986.1 hypothetical protein CFI11_22660 [Thalassococcus sp. S3]